jgi:biopolymer transport protein ExbD
MGVSVDTGGGGKKGVDVDINLVPFIDMMSCLVAFLLITAVWTNLAQIAGKPKGLANQSQTPPADPNKPYVSVLVATDSVWVGISTGDRTQIKKLAQDYDWESVRTKLAELKGLIGNDSAGNPREDIEVAAEDGVTYQQIIAAMDNAMDKGFKDVGFTDPASLTVKFKQ